MILNIKGDINEYYVQTLCLLFFPGSKFSHEKNEDQNNTRANVELIENDDSVIANVELEFDGVIESSTQTESKTNLGIFADAKRLAVAKAFFAAGKALLGITPQWGVLTGVRPCKIAMKQLLEGKTKTEIKQSLYKELFVTQKKAALVTDIASIENKIIAQAPEKSCSVYISIPFCPTRCSYCSFVSVSSKRLFSVMDEYLVKICEDIDKVVDKINELGLNICTVYIGGGTPTTLSAEQLNILLEKICSRIDIGSLQEFTVEAGRPDTVTKEKLAVLKSHGVNRISINPQTLNEEVLENIGRKHTVEQFYKAYNLGVESGIPIINTDLIAGLPGDGFGSFSETIDNIINLKPQNVTVHTLCIKSAADFAQTQTGKRARRGVATKSVDYAQASLKNAGYVPYYIYRQKNTVDNLENVGYAMPGTEGKYNIYMMEEIHSIFSVGAGAVTKLVSRDCSKIDRVFEFKYPFEYLSEKNVEKDIEKYKKIDEFYKNKY